MMNGLLEADPTLVAVVIIAIALISLVYVVGRWRARAGGGG
jgi:hypothetical protein